jgi:hypothetical protein
MRYLLLIYSEEKVKEKWPEQQKAAIFKEYSEFTESIRRSGALLAADPLQPTTTATTVRGKNGKTITTDGPFAETKEQLGGYYMVEAKNLDEAIALAARIPAVRYGGSIEVRPIMELDAVK